MKLYLMVITALIPALQCGGQTSLDQDPAERAADAAFWASRTKPSPVAGPAVPAPTALRALRTKHSAWLDVRGVAASKETTSYWETDWGSYERGYDRARRIEIEFGTVDKAPVDARLDVVFLGKGAVSIISAHYRFMTIKPGAGPQNVSEMGTSHGEADNYEALGEFYDYGQNVSNWIARLSDTEGEVLAIIASDGTLADKAWSPEWWNALSGRANWIEDGH